MKEESIRPDNTDRDSRNCLITVFNCGKNRKSERCTDFWRDSSENIFMTAERKKGITGEVLLQLIESRLDSMVFRMGFAPNRRRASQIVGHGHIMVNGRKVNLPSYQVKAGDVVEVKEASRDIPEIVDSLSKSEHRGIPGWVEVDTANFQGQGLTYSIS